MKRLSCVVLAVAMVVAGTAAADTTLTGNAYLDGSGNLVGTTLTATGGVGSVTDPYVFNVAGNLDLAGYNISGASSTANNQYSATWQVTGNVLNSGAGGGSFYSYTTSNYRAGGKVTIQADGSIALNNVRTYAKYMRDAGDVYLWAKDGSVTLDGYIDTRAAGNDYDAANVTLRSEGTLASQGIAVNGKSGAYSIITYGKVSYDCDRAGYVKLLTEGDVTLAGGINARRGYGDVTIRGDNTDTSVRAGDVEIGGDVAADCYKTYFRGGHLTVQANSLSVDGNVLLHNTGGHADGGNVKIDVLGDCTIDGYIRADNDKSDYRSSPGHVDISALHLTVSGARSGVSIDATDVYTGTYDKNYPPASSAGDVTLTGVDTSLMPYLVTHPLDGSTSSISLAGGIATGYGYVSGKPNFYGHVNIAAVEVQLGGDVSVQNTSSKIDVHYGVTTHGAITHLMENGVYGTGAHNINYGVSTPTFTADVMHAEMIPEPAGLSLLGLVLLGLRKRKRN